MAPVFQMLAAVDTPDTSSASLRIAPPPIKPKLDNRWFDFFSADMLVLG
jgi:hypothetical protein